MTKKKSPKLKSSKPLHEPVKNVDRWLSFHTVALLTEALILCFYFTKGLNWRWSWILLTSMMILAVLCLSASIGLFIRIKWSQKLVRIVIVCNSIFVLFYGVTYSLMVVVKSFTCSDDFFWPHRRFGQISSLCPTYFNYLLSNLITWPIVILALLIIFYMSWEFFQRDDVTGKLNG